MDFHSFSFLFYLSVRLLTVIYQTAHLFVGFIALPRGQLKSEANWGILANGPRTRKRDGE